MVLQCAGDDFRCRSASAVGEEDERNFWGDRVVAREECLVLPVSRANAGDLLAFPEEEVADTQRLVENPARIAAQVDDYSFRAFAPQFIDGSLEIIPRALIELEQRDVADLSVYHDRVRNGWNADNGAGECDGDELGYAGARELDEHSTPGISLKGIRSLLDSPAPGIGGIDEIDSIAFLDACLLGRGVREHTLYSYEALGLSDLHPDAGVPTIGLSVEGGQFLRRKEYAVRIIELVNQATGSFLVERGSVDGIDEAGRNDIKDLIEEPSALLALTLLEYEATGHQWDEHEAEKDAFS